MALIRRSLPISSCSSLHTFKSTKNLSIGNWTKRSYYVLPMFPYPSGALHLGHIRVYALSDAHCRYRKLLCSRDDPTGKLGNKKVLHPMGWDAFGLPAENAAKERGIRPSDWTRANIAQMKRSLQRMGFDFDWKDSELCTSDPSYYKWTQWLFLRLYKAGLVYQDRALVNWDPSEGTVLAKGEVDSEGRALRSRTIVEKRWMTQWFIRMTAFAESLHTDLDNVDWPQRVKDLQRNWIGRRTVVFVPSVPLFNAVSKESCGSTNVFINRALLQGDPSMKQYHLLIGPMHPVLHKNDTISGILAKMKPFEKVPLEFLKAPNPLDSTATRIPVALSLDVKGSDAMLDLIPPLKIHGEAPTNALVKDCARRLNGRVTTIYKLRDWLISRQRAWGTPIPIIHCPSCGPVSVPEKDLPVFVKESDTVYRSKTHTPVACPKCGSPKAHRDPDTLDTFVDSSWYWARYPSTSNSKEIISPNDASETLPVDLYIGGNEHSILHLLYARFMGKFMTKEGILDLPHGEPFKKLLTQGMVLGKTWVDDAGRYYKEEIVDREKRVVKESGVSVDMRWEKMSKSKGNGVDPERLLDAYGSDIVRLFVLSRVGASEDLVWDESGIQGMQRWIQRLDELLETYVSIKAVERSEMKQTEHHALRLLTKDTLLKVNLALNETQGLHNAISALMILSKSLQDGGAEYCHDLAWRKSFETLTVLCMTFAPEWATRAISRMGMRSPAWPSLEDLSLPVGEEQSIPFKINNKTHGAINLSPSSLVLNNSDALMNLIKSELTAWSKKNSDTKIHKLVVNRKDARIRVILLPSKKTHSIVGK